MSSVAASCHAAWRAGFSFAHARASTQDLPDPSLAEAQAVIRAEASEEYALHAARATASYKAGPGPAAVRVASPRRLDRRGSARALVVDRGVRMAAASWASLKRPRRGWTTPT